MDYNYNRIILEQYLESLFKYILKTYDENKLRNLFNDLIEGRESHLLNKNVQSELNKYSKDTIRLIIEKKIVFALENSVVGIKKTYWKVLEDRCPRINKVLLCHYYDKYIELLKNNQVVYSSETIQDLNERYNEEINKSMMLNHSFEDIIKNTSNINLNYMENLNANGRTVSIGDKKKGGIFLSKESNIEYGSFINKEEFIDKLKNEKRYKVTNRNGKLDIEELEEIINKVNQKIKIFKNEKIKNQDSRIIIDSSSNKKTGNIFLGSQGIDLPNGEYVSVDELSLAINKYMLEKNRKERKQKIIKTKGVFKKVVTAATLAISLLTTPVSATSKENIQEISSEYNLEDIKSAEQEIIVNDISHNNDILENNNDILKIDNENGQNNLQETEYVEEPILNSDEETLNVEEIVINNEEENLKESVEELTPIEDQTIEKNVEIEKLTEEENIKEEINNIDVLSENNLQETEYVEEPILNSDEETLDTEEIVINNEAENLKESTEEITPIENQTIENNIDISINNEQLESTDFSDKKVETLNETTEITEVNPINGNDIADYALQFVGNPYSSGGTSLTEGTDCSGFTQSVYSNFGIDIPRSSSSQINSGTNIGTKLENAIPGDLLCFSGHVGIYIGNGQMVHAANSRKGITINEVDYDKNKPLKAIIRPGNVIQVDEEIAKTR